VAVACDKPPIQRVKRREEDKRKYRSLGGRNRHRRKGWRKNWKNRLF